MRKITFVVLVIVAVVGWAAAQKMGSATAEAMLGAAIHQQEAEGNLEAAIAAYKRILAEHAGNRAVAAQAQFRLGTCYEKLGQGEARKAYERVLANYADQPELAAQARARLAALERVNGPAATSMSVRRVWDDAIDLGGRISGDGRYLSFADRTSGDVAVRDLRTGQNRKLTKANQERTVTAAISPDGKYVAYVWSDGTRYSLRVIGADGTGERTLLRDDNAVYMSTIAWSPDMKNVALVTAPGQPGRPQIRLVSVRDSSHQVVHTVQTGWVRHIAFSPDSRYLAYSAPGEWDTYVSDIFVLDLQNSPISASQTRVVEHPAGDQVAAWTPDGRYLLFLSDRDGTVGAWLLPMRGGRPSGAPQLVRPGLTNREYGVAPYGLTGSGAFYYGVYQLLSDAKVLTVDAAGNVGAPAAVTSRFSGVTRHPIWSPDGSRLAYRGPHGTIRIHSLDNGQQREVLPPMVQDLLVSPVWHPDGDSLVIPGVTKEEKGGLYRVDIATGAASRLIPYPSGDRTPITVAPASRTLFYMSSLKKDVVAHDLDSGQERVIYANLPGHPRPGGNIAVSRDGRYLAFGRNAIWVLPVSGGEPREVIKPFADGAILGLDWSPENKSIYALVAWNNPARTELWRVNIDGGEIRKWNTEATVEEGRGIHVHPDGRRIAFTSAQRKNEVWVMENFLPKTTDLAASSTRRTGAR